MLRITARFLHALFRHATGKWLLLGSFVGAVCGTMAVLFTVALNLLAYVALRWGCGYDPSGPAGERHLFAPGGDGSVAWWMFLLVLPVGGLISGWLVYKLAPAAHGAGT